MARRAAGTLAARAIAAAAVTRAVNTAARHLHLGGGTVIGGRAGLAVDPHLLEHLSSGRRTALVSGTNGKTTTTRLLAVALEQGEPGPPAPVATNGTGANMPQGHVAALATAPPGCPAVLEVDEGYLPALVAATGPEVVLLLNLSRDQLDRTSEVRMLAERWRGALGAASALTVVANADDPLVVWGASTAPAVVWVAAGLGWQRDAVGCPACEGRITFAGGPGGGWACGCGFARPRPDVVLEQEPGGRTVSTWPGGRRLPVELALPGRFNTANATMAAAAARVLGVPPERGLKAMAGVREVGGRFTVRSLDGVTARLMLAKNPAGWQELLDLVGTDGGPLVVGINSRLADGRDPSWLWDVPFERLGDRPVLATGERCLDLAVRLRYAGVSHRTVADPVAAVRQAGRTTADRPGTERAAVDFIGNYTAFFDVLEHPVSLVVVVVYPDLLGTYGDGGNGLVLARRAEWRGLPVELVEAPSDRPLPTGDIYCLGGGEDGPQVQAAELLRADATLTGAVTGGAAVLAVCAGYQIVGSSYPGAGGRAHPGVGLLDVTTRKGTGRRAVGEVLADPLDARLPVLSGFENHSGVTRVGPGATPLAQVRVGTGNGDAARGGRSTEGARSGRVVGTYLHGPVLARNPALADLLLGWAVAGEPLAPLDSTEEEALRAERIHRAGRRIRFRRS